MRQLKSILLSILVVQCLDSILASSVVRRNKDVFDFESSQLNVKKHKSFGLDGIDELNLYELIKQIKAQYDDPDLTDRGRIELLNNLISEHLHRRRTNDQSSVNNPMPLIMPVIPLAKPNLQANNLAVNWIPSEYPNRQFNKGINNSNSKQKKYLQSVKIHGSRPDFPEIELWRTDSDKNLVDNDLSAITNVNSNIEPIFLEFDPSNPQDPRSFKKPTSGHNINTKKESYKKLLLQILDRIKNNREKQTKLEKKEHREAKDQIKLLLEKLSSSMGKECRRNLRKDNNI